MTETPATLFLDAHAIPYRLFEHTRPVESLEQAAAERGQRPGQVVRSILFRLADDAFFMALMGGPGQISWPALRRSLGQRRLTMASPEEVLRVTGYAIGAVSPFGLPPESAGLPLLVDHSVLAEAEISLGSGRRGLAIVMQSADLLRALPYAQLGDFGN